MSVQALVPLMWSTSIEHGGLGFSPYTIGMTLGTYGMLNAFLQLMVLAKIIKWFGPRKMHIVCFSSLIVSVLCFQVASFFARRSGRTDWTMWTIVIISLASQSMRAGAYGSMMVIMTPWYRKWTRASDGMHWEIAWPILRIFFAFSITPTTVSWREWRLLYHDSDRCS